MATRKHSAARPSLPAHPAGRAVGRKPRSAGLWLALAVVALVGGALALTLIRSAGGGQLSAARVSPTGDTEIIQVDCEQAQRPG